MRVFDNILMQLSAILTELLSAKILLTPIRIINGMNEKHDVDERLQFLVMIDTMYLLKTSGVDIVSDYPDIEDNLLQIEKVITDMEKLRKTMKRVEREVEVSKLPTKMARA